jgi:predicted CXXCH cytochrome family protein
MMASTNKIKVALLTLFSLVVFAWAISGTFSNAIAVETEPTATAAAAIANPDDYVGSETCMACHEGVGQAFAATKHAKLKDVSGWKDKVQGCESCHGPGAKHLEDPTVPNSIVRFGKMDSKAISETCLGCHAGRETHNNFRRGEHWRNDVGCTECHSPHGQTLKDSKAGSSLFVAETSHQNPGIANVMMLKQSEPQLCMSCHNETKSQFIKPFHHKVLEGTMKCTDCHNAHGGFETKQTKLAVGVDASCVKCHTNKQGPFVFEHAPLKTEGCAACHTPHGSSNPKMLNRPVVRQLCMECHSEIVEDQSAPGTPSFHNQAVVRYKDCTVCHNAIHGSNSSKVFFR